MAVMVIVLCLSALRLLYFLQWHASPLALVTPSGLDSSLNHRLAMELLHGEVSQEFHLASCYTYLVAFLYLIGGSHPELVRIAQLVMGIGSCVLVYWLAREMFNQTVATIALALHGLYGPVIFHEGLLISTTMGLLLSLLLARQLLSLQGKPRLSGWYLAGVLLGLLGHTIHVAWSLIPLVSLWIIRHTRGTWPRVLSLLSVGLGISTMVLSLMGSKALWVRDATVLPAHSGINFYIGNNPEADGTFYPPLQMRSSQLGLLHDSRLIAEQRLGKSLTDHDVNRFWFHQGMEFIVEHPMAFLTLLGRKLLIVLNGYEPPDLEDFYFAKRQMPLLGLPLPSFYLIAPLGLLGWMLTRRDEKSSLLRLFILGYGLSNLLYFVTARYRLPALPYLTILASWSLSWLATKVAERNPRKLVWPGCALIGLVVLTSLRLFRHDFAYAYLNLSVRYADTNDLAHATETALEAIRINPRLPDAHFNLGVIAYRQGRIEEARERFLTAWRLRPRYYEAAYNLGLLAEETGQLDEAIRFYGAALALNPSDEQVHVNVGCAYLKANALALAHEAFDTAKRLHPSLDETLRELERSRCGQEKHGL